MAYKSQHIFELFGAVGALGSIAGIIFWLMDADRREEENAIRKNELLRVAKDIIAEEASDGAFYSTRDVMWAFKVHARFQDPLEISASKVEIALADLSCLDIRFKSSNVMITESYLVRTFVDLEDSTLDIDRSYLSDNIISNNQVVLNPAYDSDCTELRFATIIKNSVVMGLSVDAWSQQASNVSFLNSFVTDLGAAIEPHIFSTTGSQIVENGELNEDLCATSVSRERDQIVYVECHLKDQKSTDAHRVFLREWAANSIISRNLGKPITSVCVDTSKIDISKV